MRTHKFEPASHVDDDGKKPFKHILGHILLRLPTCDEMLDYAERLAVDGDREEGKLPLGNAKTMRIMLNISKGHYQEVALRNTDTEEDFKSFDDLNSDPQNIHLLSVISALLMSGLSKPSKKSKPL